MGTLKSQGTGLQSPLLQVWGVFNGIWSWDPSQGPELPLEVMTKRPIPGTRVKDKTMTFIAA